MSRDHLALIESKSSSSNLATCGHASKYMWWLNHYTSFQEADPAESAHETSGSQEKAGVRREGMPQAAIFVLVIAIIWLL